jgi:hypothetical protein
LVTEVSSTKALCETKTQSSFETETQLPSIEDLQGFMNPMENPFSPPSSPQVSEKPFGSEESFESPRDLENRMRVDMNTAPLCHIEFDRISGMTDEHQGLAVDDHALEGGISEDRDHPLEDGISKDGDAEDVGTGLSLLKICLRERSDTTLIKNA